MNSRSKIDIYHLLYYITFGVLQINALRAYSLLTFYDITAVKYLLIMFSTILPVVVFVSSLSRYKNDDIPKVLGVLLFVLIVGFNSEKVNLLWNSFVLVVGAKGMRFQNIVKFHFIVGLCFCLLNVAGNQFGMSVRAANVSGIEREGLLGMAVERKDFAYGWATDFANHVFFLLLEFWIIIKGKLNIWGYLAYIAISFFIIEQTDSRMAAGCILLILLFSLYLKWLIISRTNAGLFMTWGLTYSIIFFAIISVIVVLLYKPTDPFWFATNLIFSNRLSHGANAITEFGITWFGQPVEMYGLINVEKGQETNFVDSTYLQYLIRYGIVLLTILILIFVLLARRAVKRGDTVFVIALFIASLVGVISQFLFEYRYCVLILALMATHDPIVCRNPTNNKLKRIISKGYRRQMVII